METAKLICSDEYWENSENEKSPLETSFEHQKRRDNDEIRPTHPEFSSTSTEREEFDYHCLSDEELEFLSDNDTLFNMSDDMFEEHIKELTDMRDERKNHQ